MFVFLPLAAELHTQDDKRRRHDHHQGGDEPPDVTPLLLHRVLGNFHHRLQALIGLHGLFSLFFCHRLLPFFRRGYPAAQKLSNTDGQLLCQRLQQCHIGVAKPAFPLADSLVRHMKLFGKLHLGHTQLFSVFSNIFAKALFIHRCHLAFIIAVE